MRKPGNCDVGVRLLVTVTVPLGLLLSACRPSIPADQAQKEIVAFTPDYIVREELGRAGDYARASGQPWANAPFDADIIVWAPPSDAIDKATLGYLKRDRPGRVWWLEGNQLTEVTSDLAAAVQDYRQTHILTPPSPASSGGWGWGYYEFGILSLSSGNWRAQVYVGVSCGPVCGTGRI